MVVCEPLSAVTRRGLSNKHFAESAQLYVRTSSAEDEGKQSQILMESCCLAPIDALNKLFKLGTCKNSVISDVGRSVELL